MRDSFESSLKELFNDQDSRSVDTSRLDRVLKKANRQVGAADLFGLLGCWFEALMLALHSGTNPRSVVVTKRLKSAAVSRHSKVE